MGYNEVAHNFVFLQRTLACIQSVALQKVSLISSVDQEAKTAYEIVAPYVEKRMVSVENRMASVVKKTVQNLMVTWP